MPNSCSCNVPIDSFWWFLIFITLVFTQTTKVEAYYNRKDTSIESSGSHYIFEAYYLSNSNVEMNGVAVVENI